MLSVKDLVSIGVGSHSDEKMKLGRAERGAERASMASEFA
jgi:hypothetical protein